MELISDQGFRVDGRKANELRRIRCRMGMFAQADGSAYLEQGNTKVLATIYGPHEAAKSKMSHENVLINCQYSMATFSTAERKNRPRGDRKSIEMAMSLKQTFEAAIITTLYPRSQIDIYVEVLQSDGGNLSTCINAATIALIDAGIGLRDYVCSATVAFIDNNVLCDVSHMEETAYCPTIVAAVLPKSNQIAFLQMDGRLHEDHLQKLLDALTLSCTEILQIIDRHVRSQISTRATTLRIS